MKVTGVQGRPLSTEVKQNKQHLTRDDKTRKTINHQLTQVKQSKHFS